MQASTLLYPQSAVAFFPTPYSTSTPHCFTYQECNEADALCGVLLSSFNHRCITWSDQLGAAVINYSRIPIWEKRGVILFNSQKLFSVTGCACALERENDRDRKKVIKSAKKTKGKQRTRGFEKKKKEKNTAKGGSDVGKDKEL